MAPATGTCVKVNESLLVVLPLVTSKRTVTSLCACGASSDKVVVAAVVLLKLYSDESAELFLSHGYQPIPERERINYLSELGN